MNVDPNTTVQRLLGAFPAAREHLQRLGIDVSSNDPLFKACEKAGIRLADVQTALANIDWTPIDDDFKGVDAPPCDA
jgi:hypothetical protein